MAIVYCKPGISLGTGTGSVGDPFNIQETISSANANGITTSDAIAVMTDGATFEAVTAGLVLPVASCSIVPVDYSGALTDDNFLIDGAGATGDLFLVGTGANCMLVGATLKNAAAKGLRVTGDRATIWNIHIIDPGTDGIENVNGADQADYTDITIEGVTNGHSFVDGVAIDAASMVNLYIKNHNSIQTAIETKAGYFKGLVLEVDVTSLTSIWAFQRLANSTKDSALIDATIILKGDGGTLSSDPRCYYNTSSSPSNGHSILSNVLIVDRMTNKGATESIGYYFGDTDISVFGRGLAYDNIDIPITNEPTLNSPQFDTPLSVTADFVDDTAGDFRPQNDLTSNVLKKKLAEEGVDWRDAGALSHLLAGGGGGGGMLVHPGMAGGMRG